MAHYAYLDSSTDDNAKQYQLGMKLYMGLLDESRPVEAMTCLQMVGFPMQYSRLRKVEEDALLQDKLWEISEKGLAEVYPKAFSRLNAKWTHLKLGSDSTSDSASFLSLHRL